MVRVVGDDGVEAVLQTVDGILSGLVRGLLHIVGGQVADEVAQQGDTGLLVRDGELGHAGLGGVHRRTAEGLGGHVLAGDSLHDLRAGDEHIAGVLGHHDEVGEGRGIDCAAGTGTEDGGDLRHHAGSEDVALENLGIAGQAVDAFLDTGSAGVIEADDGCADLHGLVHHLADLRGEGFGKGTAEHGEILGENIDQTAVHCAVAGHHTVGEELVLLDAEVHAAVGYEHVELLKAALVEEHQDALARGIFTLGVLFVNLVLTAA